MVVVKIDEMMMNELMMMVCRPCSLCSLTVSHRCLCLLQQPMSLWSTALLPIQEALERTGFGGDGHDCM
jgi:hypothetical protein